MNTKVKNASSEKSLIEQQNEAIAAQANEDIHAGIVAAIGSDEHTGQGGVFSFDAATGLRTKVN